MKTMFFVSQYNDRIEQLEVSKETEKCLWYTRRKRVESGPGDWSESRCGGDDGAMIRKSGSGHETFATLDEAVQSIRQRYARRIQGAEESVVQYTKQSRKFDERAMLLLGEFPIGCS